MPKYIGDKLLKARYVGDKAVTKIYRGASLVWGAIKESLAFASGKSMTLVNCTREESLKDFKIYGRSEQETYKGTNKIHSDFTHYAGHNVFSVTEENGESVLSIDQSGWETQRWYSWDSTQDFDISVAKNGFYLSFDYYTTDPAMIWQGSHTCFARIQGYNADRVRTNWIQPYLDGSYSYLWITRPTAINTWQRVKLFFSYDIINGGLTQGAVSYFKIGFCLTMNGSYKIKNPMLSYGNIDEPYEKFVGGIPSPNPDFPQSIEPVVDPVVTYSGANLWNPSIAVSRLNATITKDGDRFSVSPSGTSPWSGFYTNSFQLTVGKTYTVSAYCTCSIPMRWGVGKEGQGYPYYDSLANETIRVSHTFTKTKESNNAIVFYAIKTSGNHSADEIITVEDIQIEYGSNVTDYEPYKEPKSYTWNHALYGIPVSSGGNYTDESGQQWIADYVDVENKQIVRNVHRTHLTSAEKWARTNAKIHFYVSSYGVDIKYLGALICDKLIHGNRDAAEDGGINMSTHVNSYLIGGRSQFTTFAVQTPQTLLGTWSVADFKNWLDSIDGLNVMCILNSPMYEPLTDAEVEAFKQLKTFKPTTIITNNYDAHMSTSYHTKLEELDAMSIRAYNNTIEEVTR